MQLTLYSLELYKMLHRRSLQIAFWLTTLGFPLLMMASNLTGFRVQELHEGNFFQVQTYSTLSIIQLIFFIPLWSFLFSGQEWSWGYVQRCIMLRSRSYYFFSRLVYGSLVALYFTLLVAITLMITHRFSPFGTLELPIAAWLWFIPQTFVVSLTTALVMECLVMWTGSGVLAIGVYFIWSFFEVLAFSWFNSWNSRWTYLLPRVNLSRTYLLNGKSGFDQYCNPFPDDLGRLLIPITTTVVIVYVTYLYFRNRTIRGLSD